MALRIGKFLCALALICSAGTVLAQAGAVWTFQPDAPGTSPGTQARLTYWQPDNETVLFDAGCGVGAAGEAQLVAGFAYQAGFDYGRVADADGTVELLFYGPDGAPIGVPAQLLSQNGDLGQPNLWVSLPLDHPVILGISYWEDLRFRIAGGPLVALPLWPVGREEAWAMVTHCVASSPTTPDPWSQSVIGWSYDDQGDGVLRFIHEYQNLIGFEAQCADDGSIDLMLAAAAGNRSAGETATIETNELRGPVIRLSGTLFDFRDTSGHMGLRAQVDPQHPFLAALRAGGYIGYHLQGYDVWHELDMTGAEAAVEAFFAGCAQTSQGSGNAAAAGTPAPALSQAAGSVLRVSADPTSCAQLGSQRSHQNLSAIRVSFANLLVNDRALFWLDLNGAAHQVAYLTASTEVQVDTDMAHAWMVTDANGVCQSIFRLEAGLQRVEFVQ